MNLEEAIKQVVVQRYSDIGVPIRHSEYLYVKDDEIAEKNFSLFRLTFKMFVASYQTKYNRIWKESGYITFQTFHEIECEEFYVPQIIQVIHTANKDKKRPNIVIVATTDPKDDNEYILFRYLINESNRSIISLNNIYEKEFKTKYILNKIDNALHFRGFYGIEELSLNSDPVGDIAYFYQFLTDLATLNSDAFFYKFDHNFYDSILIIKEKRDDSYLVRLTDTQASAYCFEFVKDAYLGDEEDSIKNMILLSRWFHSWCHKPVELTRYFNSWNKGRIYNRLKKMYETQQLQELLRRVEASRSKVC